MRGITMRKNIVELKDGDFGSRCLLCSNEVDVKNLGIYTKKGDSVITFPICINCFVKLTLAVNEFNLPSELKE